MTTENDDVLDRQKRFGNRVYDEGVYPTGYQDPSGVYPRSQYYYESSINKASRGLTRNDLSTNGGIPTLQNRNILSEYQLNKDRYANIRVTQQATSILDKNADPVGITSEGIPVGAISGEPVFNYVPPQEEEKRRYSTYPNNQVWETPGGHVVELDDTITNERILIKHQSGAGIEIKPDGSVFVSSTSDVLISAGNDQHVVVEGNAHMTYQGDLNVDVAGDYNLSVGGNKLQIITGDHISEIDGARKGNIALQDNLTVKGHQYTTVVESKTDLTLGGYTHAVKGEFEQAVEGEMKLHASGAQRITSQVRQNLTSPDTNIFGNKLTVIGEEGTIGSEETIMYARNLYAGHTLFVGDGAGGSGTINVDTVRAVRIDVEGDITATNSMTAPTFHGDLDGASSVTRSQSYGENVTSGGSINNNPTNTTPLPDDTTATALPSSDFALIYLASEYGIQDVKVDPENELKKLINQTTLSGGVSDRPLTISEIRSKLRDENNKNNEDFTGKQVAENKLNPEALGSKSIPAETGRTASNDPTVVENISVIGPAGAR